MNNLFSMLQDTAQMVPDQPVIYFKDDIITYKQLFGYVCGAAQAYQPYDIQMGDRVSILMGNLPQFMIAYYGLAAIGAVAVPSNPLLKADELTYIYNNAEVKAVVTIPQLLPVVLATLPRVPSLKHIFVCTGDAEGAISFDPLWQKADAPIPVTPEFDPAKHPAVFMYTSGTTGYPKGCMLSHRNLLANSTGAKMHLGLGPGTVIFCVLPLFHAFAATICMHLTFISKASVVINEKFIPDSVLDAIERYKVTVLPMVPTMFAALAQFGSKSPEKLASVVQAISGGAPLPGAVLNAFKEKFGVTIFEGDGPTECSPVTSVNPVEGVQKVGSIGIPIPGVEMKIFDDKDNELPTNESGEIVVRGDSVMLGYHNMPEETAEVMTSGWYHTGDIGKKDEDGYFYILDRKKDMLLVGGLNVYPREVEEVIAHHPAVMETAVVGEFDKLRGEAPVAYVVLKPDQQATAKEILKWCRQKLATYKVPKRVIFRDNLPKSATMKILKRLLRKELDQEAGIGDKS